MVILVSLLTAVLFGSGDFCGGWAAKRTSSLYVVAGSHTVGLFGAVVASLIVGATFDPGDVGFGAVGGLFGGFGVWLLYRRLAIGPMHVVAPLTAIASAVVPALWGLGTGEQLSRPAWVGIIVGLIAIGMISATGPTEPRSPIGVAVVVESLLAGCGFAGFFILLDATDASSAPWPIVGARILTSVGLVIVLATRRAPFVMPVKPVVVLIGAAGVLDTAANIGFLYATTHGQLAVVSVLSSLYPVATVILARIFLTERMTRAQQWGFVAALMATGLISVS